MNIASTPFLFLFLPAAVGIYFLIPTGNGLRLRNLFLLSASLFFYAWGEPVYIFLLLALILAVWLFGKMAEGCRSQARGRWAVALTVMVGIGTLLSFKYLKTEFPTGMSFFCFHAISYVVDIYRGQCRSQKNILNTALYLSVFYKILQGPIITFREFEPQIEHRESSWNDVGEGLWRFAIGFGKKMIIALNLQPMLTVIFTSDTSSLSMADTWLGCAAYLVFLYFDFSGYSDMAIGLGRVFGFKTPENFNYPYISTSIAEYWRRWHITLIAWFRDYLYYPILLGPSVRFRKYLLRHNVDTALAKTLQNIFVPACVWTVTALWHGTNWNFTIWGLVNCTVIVLEPYIRPLRHHHLDKFLRWAGMMVLLALMVPLINTGSPGSAAGYLKVMITEGNSFTLSPLVWSLLKECGVFLAAGVIGCFPVLPYVKRQVLSRCGDQMRRVWNVGEAVAVMAIVILSLGYLFENGTVWFMYQR